MSTQSDEPFGFRASDYYNEPFTLVDGVKVAGFYLFVLGLPVTAGCLLYVFGNNVTGWDAVLAGAGVGTIPLICLLAAGACYRERVRHLKGKPLQIGERFVVTRGKYSGKFGTVQSTPQCYPYQLLVVLDDFPDGRIRTIDWAHLERLIESSTPPAAPSP